MSVETEIAELEAILNTGAGRIFANGQKSSATWPPIEGPRGKSAAPERAAAAASGAGQDLAVT